MIRIVSRTKVVVRSKQQKFKTGVVILKHCIKAEHARCKACMVQLAEVAKVTWVCR